MKKRILAVDYGEVRIGLAVSDPLGLTAQGLPTLKASGREKNIVEIARVAKEFDAAEIVIGLPINMNGTMGPKAKQVLELVPDLEREAGLPVKTWDERLSSREVTRLMVEEGLSRGKQRQTSDRLAATVILQNYLEACRNQRKTSE